MRDQLLGYLLNALDDADRDAVQLRLASDPALARELESLADSLEPLADDEADVSPPPGLAARTCALVANRVDASRVELAERSPTRGAWRLVDALVAMGLIAASALLFFPALIHSRNTANLQACQDHLRQLHQAHVAYADRKQGLFPSVPQSGPESAAGIYAVQLHHGGFVPDARTFVCPPSSLARSIDDFQIPSLDRLSTAAPLELPGLQSTMGGSYGYTLGHMAGGTYVPTQNHGRSHFVLMADTPEHGLLSSGNHGGSGQNVLFEDGRVLYLTSARIDGQSDNYYRNDRNEIGVGLNRDDSVVVPSGIGPNAPLTP